MNRDAFIDRLAKRLGDRSAARAALEAFIAEARGAAAKGETISVAGLLITYPADMPASSRRTSPPPAKKATPSKATKAAKTASTSSGPGFPTGRNNPAT